LEAEAERTIRVLDSVEEDEVTRIRQSLAGEATSVEGMTRQVNAAILDADELGTGATREGFEALAKFFGDSVMRADMGIVDVYWARKVQVSDRIDELNRERADLLKDMDRRFQTINAKLEE